MRRRFFDVGGQSVLNEGSLGTLFKIFCCKAGKAKPMVSFAPNNMFHSFQGCGLGMLGIFFQVVFQTGSGMRFCDRSHFGSSLLKPGAFHGRRLYVLGVSA